MKALACGAGGFIGSHLVTRSKQEGWRVRGIDVKYPELADTAAEDFIQGDLRALDLVRAVIDQRVDGSYQLAADMGGAGFVFTGENDADIMHGSAMINVNVLDVVRQVSVGKIYYASSAFLYPKRNQFDPANPVTSEGSAYPAAPDSEYGWEKLFSERLYMSYARNSGVAIRIARFHNLFGEEGTWGGGREKAPAAICRKVTEAEDGDEVEIWGDGEQTRSFLLISECLEGVRRMMDGSYPGPVNIGSEEMISTKEFARLVISSSGKDLRLNHISGPLGVRGRRSDNALIWQELGRGPARPLRWGVERTYRWGLTQVEARHSSKRTVATDD